MRKPKLRHQRGSAMNIKQAAHFTGSTKYDNEEDLAREDDWVVVKRQRVIILVPPLTVANEPTMQEPLPAAQRAIATSAVNEQSQHPAEKPTDAHFIEKRKRSKPLASREVQEVRRANSDRQAVRFEPSDLNVRVQSRFSDQVGISRDQKGPRACNTFKSITQPRFSHGPRCLLGGSLLSQRMRMINLERKLQKAGGLSKWLASLGLNQFVKIFERRNFSKFELVNLTMKKLEDMGASAVGPRRKLMHAIACLC